MLKTAVSSNLSELGAKLRPYSVGALLYAPGTNGKLIDGILHHKIQEAYSAALCLEDSISGPSVAKGEELVVQGFRQMKAALEAGQVPCLPKLFIRVRTPDQVEDLFRRLGEDASILTGFIFPKYCPECAADYNSAILEVNRRSEKRVYMMPTLESGDIADPLSRMETLGKLKAAIDSVSPLVLNVRVGGNDFCNAFGMRRHYDETIHEIACVSQIFGAIISVFVPRYVVSGPVWEYFSSPNWEWKQGLMRELKQDKLNGFIGKTVIHPKQIAVVNEAMRVSRKDYEDALSILNWSGDSPVMVSKNFSGERMNEVNTHTTWAEKIVILAKIYGVE